MTERAQEFNDRWAKAGCDIDLWGCSSMASAAMSWTT